jgi:hypothetical protein
MRLAERRHGGYGQARFNKIANANTMAEDGRARKPDGRV